MSFIVVADSVTPGDPCNRQSGENPFSSESPHRGSRVSCLEPFYYHPYRNSGK